MKDTSFTLENTENNENTIKVKKRSPVLEKIGNFFFGLFVTFLFTLPVWCILMIVMYFMNRI